MECDGTEYAENKRVLANIYAPVDGQGTEPDFEFDRKYFSKTPRKYQRPKRKVWV